MKLRAMAADPARHLTKFRSVGACKIRVGDDRIVLDVDWEGRILYVLTVGHRGTLYR